MGQRHKTGVTRVGGTEQEMRDQEVLRAKKELAAYFNGQRTEREARAALKIIKAFIRDRERRDARSRPPLPGSDALKIPKAAADRKAVSARRERNRPRRRPKPHDPQSQSVTAAIERAVKPEPSRSSGSDEPTPD
jgi:hypothetical protein